nr:hypothetical protein [Gammaproteobacteria bacterium]
NRIRVFKDKTNLRQQITWHLNGASKNKGHFGTKIVHRNQFGAEKGITDAQSQASRPQQSLDLSNYCRTSELRNQNASLALRCTPCTILEHSFSNLNLQ